MLTEEQQIHFGSLRIELIDLSVLACFYIRKMNRLGFVMKNSTRHYLLEEFVAQRYMENGIILHLTNLDDDRSNFSFREVLKVVGKVGKERKLIETLRDKLKRYRQSLNNLKVHHRNKRIAHLLLGS